jgi:protein involved in polysaccharide export with SLBB domain
MADTSVYNSIFKFNLSDSLVLKTTSLAIALEPYDIVNVKNLPRNKGVGSVTIKGEVLFPGTYQLNTKNDRVSDLVRRAGGVLTTGSIASAAFLRNVFPYSSDVTILEIKKKLAVKQVEDSISEKKLVNTIESSKQLLAFNLSSALDNPYSAQDILLEEGDLIQVPKAPTTVQVFGAVSIEKKIVYQPGMGVRELIGESGGFTDAANKNALYILYPNGRVSTTKKFLFFPRAYPRLLAGAEVYVPERKRKKALSTGELLGIGSSVIGIATLVFAIINSTK